MLSSILPPPPSLQHLLVLIPAWKPDERLRILVQQLAQCGFGAVLVVDDGSPASFTPLFDSVKLIPSVLVLHHASNRGKGRALKTGMDYILRSLPRVRAVITADADGQHTLADILSVARGFTDTEDRIVLGMRTFNGAVPLRCRVGNAITRKLFRLLTGIPLADTQSGLRAVPRSLLPQLLSLPGERYEYEIAQLVHLCRTGRPPLEISIQTLYLDGNRSSHFKPLRDSLRILLALVSNSQ